MSNLMTTQQFPDLLRVGIRKVFLNEYNSYPEFYSRIFNVETSDKAYEEELLMAGFGLVPEWNSDGQELPTDKILTGERVLYVHKDYGMLWTVSKRLLREDMYGKVGKELVKEAVRAMKTTIEVVAHSVINNGFGGSRPLFSDRQQLIGGGTFSNRIASALTPAGLQSALTRFRRWVNHRGHPIVLEPKILLVPPELEWAAKTLLHSTSYPNVTFNSGGTGPVKGDIGQMTSEGVINVLRSAVDTLIVDPYLVDPYNWFLLTDKSQHKLRFFWRERPNTELNERDFRTKGVMHSITCAFSVGFTDWFGVLGAEGS
ncbi:MAG: Mu-like prophage major head subunit gpT family protein [Nitrososphaerota archaeon]